MKMDADLYKNKDIRLGYNNSGYILECDRGLELKIKGDLTLTVDGELNLITVNENINVDSVGGKIQLNSRESKQIKNTKEAEQYKKENHTEKLSYAGLAQSGIALLISGKLGKYKAIVNVLLKIYRWVKKYA